MNEPWAAIFEMHKIDQHDFSRAPFQISSEQIKQATRHFKNTSSKEVRILCKQDTRESRPQVFKERGLFLLPVRNGYYVIVKGEGYVDIPKIESEAQNYRFSLGFPLDTVKVGDSEMQHLDFAYAVSLVRTFLEDNSLVLTIRGRKFTPKFSFRVGTQQIEVQSVQTEVDAGYEGRSKVVLIEAKNSFSPNTIIRQLYYPYRQWQACTSKPIIPVFFEKDRQDYKLWQFKFEDESNYNSIRLVKTSKFSIVE